MEVMKSWNFMLFLFFLFSMQSYLYFQKGNWHFFYVRHLICPTTYSDRYGFISCVLFFVLIDMATSNSDVSASITHAPTSISPSPSSSSVSVSASHKSCRTKKTEGASFIQDVRDHFDEFVHASMDEHKACFKNTLNKVSGGFVCQDIYLYI